MATIAENLETLQNTLTDIKTALASKGVTPSDALVDVPDEIDSIQTGTTPVLQSITINDNGTYTPGVGVDGYNEVIVNVQPVSSNISIKVLFPDNNTASRAWRSSGMQIEYTTDGETWTTVSRSGTSTKYNTYTVPINSYVRAVHTVYGQQVFYNDDGGDNYSTGTYDILFPVNYLLSYTEYGQSATDLYIQQEVKATANDQIIHLCISPTNRDNR